MALRALHGGGAQAVIAVVNVVLSTTVVYTMAAFMSDIRGCLLRHTVCARNS